MRTTIDLPPSVHRRARELARQRHQSLSSVLSDLAVRGLASLGEPVDVTTDPVSGLPTITIGRTITAADVSAALDEK